jgi:tellurite resistance protein TehA-like permease
MRLLGGFIIIVLFLSWVIYRHFVKQDLKNHMTEFYSGIAFALAWAVLYYFILG